MPHRYALRFMAATLLVGAVGCSSPQATQPAKPPRAPVAEHTIVTKKDLSFGGSHRFQVRVSLPKVYDRQTVEAIAHAIAEDLSSAEPINEVSILFYSPDRPTTGAADVGLVDWAPHGQWGDGNTVKAGDYSTFEYRVSYFR